MSLEELYRIFRSSSGAATDSRTVRGGELFFALKGENFDGNDYALNALEKGASYAVVDRPPEGNNSRIIPVGNALETLKDLAALHRNMHRNHLKVIGLTGTNGKTTTKELMCRTLSKKYRVTATEGNLNNDIGVPLSVLKINDATEVAVIEMGASHPDDIKALVKVSQPDYGLVTNIGKAHLLGFGSYEGVKRAKGQLYDYMAAHGGSVFVNADDAVLLQMAEERHLPAILYGLKHSGASLLPGSPFLRLALHGIEINTRLIGAYNTPNVLAAIAVGGHFGVSLPEAAAAIEEYVPSNHRSEWKETGRNVLIADMYNANPSSMAAALENFRQLPAARKAAIIGNMGELGKDSLSEHIKVLKLLDSLRLEKIYIVGEEFRRALDRLPGPGNRMMWFRNSEELAEYFAAHPLEGCTLLVKGSRSVQLEKVVPML